MQKLMLTSAGFENKKIEEMFLKLVGLPADRIKVIFIPTAAITEEQKAIVPLCKNDLLGAGILEGNIVTYDLDRPMNCNEICDFNGIYVCGGNSKHLLDKIIEAQFHIPLKKFLENGGVYTGVSAGSIVLASNLPNNLGYINCNLSVHAKDGTECGNLDTSDCPDVKLTDDQAIIIIDNDVFVIE